MKDTVQSIRDNDLRDTANKAGHKVREFLDHANEEVTHAAKAVSSHVHDKPMQSSIIALGLGFILGALFRR